MVPGSPKVNKKRGKNAEQAMYTCLEMQKGILGLSREMEFILMVH